MNYLFLAIETGLPPDLVVNQMKPSIIRLSGILVDKEFNQLDTVDLKMDVKEITSYNQNVLDRYTTYKEFKNEETLKYNDFVYEFLFFIKNAIDTYDGVVLAGHNVKQWLYPVLNHLKWNCDGLEFSYVIEFLANSIFKYVCTMEIANAIKMLSDSWDDKISLFHVYTNYIGQGFPVNGAMLKAKQSLEVYKFFKECLE
jgi:hypothetical protein